MQTVVGVFDTSSDAEAARYELINAGFDEDSMRLQSHAEEGGEGFMSSVGHFFRDLFGGDDKQSGEYAEAVRRGGSVLTVDVDDEARAMTARQLMAAGGAVNLDKRTEQWREQGYSNFDPAAEPYRADQIQAERGSNVRIAGSGSDIGVVGRHGGVASDIGVAGNNTGVGSGIGVGDSNRNVGVGSRAASGIDKVLPVVREDIEIGKREVDLGAVRVFTRMESKPVSETVELREQRAEIERRPVDRPATDADLKAFEGGAIEVRETAERAVVSKTARVVEEVSVGTQTSSKNETISDTVRNTVVEVQKGNAMQDGVQDQAAGYRTHFDRNLASGGGRYEEYEPAYQYGSSLGTDNRYANRSWNDFESDAEQDWTRRNPGTAWERAKAAVRHGWESATGSGSSHSTSGTQSSGMGSGSPTSSPGTSGVGRRGVRGDL